MWLPLVKNQTSFAVVSTAILCICMLCNSVGIVVVAKLICPFLHVMVLILHVTAAARVATAVRSGCGAATAEDSEIAELIWWYSPLVVIQFRDLPKLSLPIFGQAWSLLVFPSWCGTSGDVSIYCWAGVRWSGAHLSDLWVGVNSHDSVNMLDEAIQCSLGTRETWWYSR